MTHDQIKAAIKKSIAKTRPEELQFLTTTSLLNMAGKDADVSVLMHVVPELVEDKTLTQHGIFFDIDGEEHTLDVVTLEEVLDLGVAIHPETGEHINKKDIQFFYSAKD